MQLITQCVSVSVVRLCFSDFGDDARCRRFPAICPQGCRTIAELCERINGELGRVHAVACKAVSPVLLSLWAFTVKYFITSSRQSVKRASAFTSSRVGRRDLVLAF